MLVSMVVINSNKNSAEFTVISDRHKSNGALIVAYQQPNKRVSQSLFNEMVMAQSVK